MTIPNEKSTYNELFSTNKFIQDFCTIANSVGISKEDFSRDIGLSVDCIDEPQGVVSLHYIVKSYSVLLEHTSDELLATQEKTLPKGAISLMIKSACSESILSSAITAIHDVNRICQSPMIMKLIVEEKVARWQFSLATKDPNLALFSHAMLTSIATQILSMLLKKDVNLLSVSFVGNTPINVCDYQFLYSCPVKFNQAYNELVFDKAWLSKPILCNYKEVKEHLKVPLSITKYTFKSLGLIKKIKGIIALSSQGQFPTQSELASQLGISVRTMQRKLETESSNYMAIKDEFRHKKALFYLEFTDKSLSYITEFCGFSEVASFTRAFVRWQGCTPSKYQLKTRK
ncbi:MAG: AraC family transcriptional regulator ligand-binding domain-containing protein [Colwellia sp.]